MSSKHDTKNGLLENEPKGEELKKALHKSSYREARKKAEDLGIRMLDPGEGESVLKYLMSLGKRASLLVILLAGCVGLIPTLIAFIEGNAINPLKAPDVMHDFLHITLIPLGIPVAVSILIVYFQKFPRIILQLCLSGVVSITKKQMNKYVVHANNYFNNKWLFVISMIVGIVVALADYILFVLYNPNNTWQVSPHWQFGSIAGITDKILIGVLIYLLMLGVMKLAGTYLALRKLLENPTTVQPLHPDRCGGLALLGQLSRRLNLTVFYFGIVIISAIHVIGSKYSEGEQFPLVVPIIVISYVIAAAVVVFLPLNAAHGKMNAAKITTAEILSNRYETLQASVLEKISENQSIPVNTVEELRNLREMHDIAMRMPVYPADTRTIASFISSVLLPIVLALLPELPHMLGLW